MDDVRLHSGDARIGTGLKGKVDAYETSRDIVLIYCFHTTIWKDSTGKKKVLITLDNGANIFDIHIILVVRPLYLLTQYKCSFDSLGLPSELRLLSIRQEDNLCHHMRCNSRRFYPCQTGCCIGFQPVQKR